MKAADVDLRYRGTAPWGLAVYRVLAARRVLVCTAMLALAACQKSPAPGTDQPAEAPSAAPTAGGEPPPSPAPAIQPAAPSTPEVAAAPPEIAPPPVEVKPVVIPAGTHLSVRLEGTLGSATSTVGENFTGTLVNGVTIKGATAIRRHVPVVGKVIGAKSAGKFAGAASLELQLESVADHSIVTSTYSRQVAGKGHRTAAVIGGTAVAGALLGALAGHGRGAAIGAAAGGGIGTLGAAETGNNRDIVLPQGTVLTFKLAQSIAVQPPPEATNRP